MTNWLKIIEDNREKIQSVAEQAYKDALDYRNMRFIVEVTDEGKATYWGDVTGGNSFSRSSFEGSSYPVCEFCYQCIDFPITEDDLLEYMTEEQKGRITEIKEEGDNLFEAFPEIVTHCENDCIKEWKEEAPEEAEAAIDHCIEELEQEEKIKLYY